MDATLKQLCQEELDGLTAKQLISISAYIDRMTSDAHVGANFAPTTDSNRNAYDRKTGDKIRQNDTE